MRKGWYNLEESSDDIYKKSKLRQFLRCLNLMMEACMRTLLTNSVKEYAAFLKACTATEVTVEDCSTVTNDDKFRRPPLFAVDLAVEGEGPNRPGPTPHLSSRSSTCRWSGSTTS